MPSKPSPRSIIIPVAALLVVLVVALGLRAMVIGGEGAGAPAVGGAFTLVDHTGRTVTDADFRGKYMLLYFGYTFCPDVCPTSLSAIAEALDKLPEDKLDRVVPLFITVDPERDTPEVIGDYVAAFHPRLVGLTGSREQIDAAIAAYKVYAAKVEVPESDYYLMDHSSITYLMGPDGRMVRFFPHGASPEDIAKGLEEVL